MEWCSGAGKGPTRDQKCSSRRLAVKLITFLSDYGTEDEFVGVCKGVIAGIAPDVRVIDITHGIRPQQVQEGALVLAQTITYFPPGIHIAIVDPGVGSSRRPVVVGAADGRVFVGPDNGLLPPAAGVCGGMTWCRMIENERFILPDRSRTFHGRDIFAPAAAHLALGIDADDLGPPVSLDSVVKSEMPAPEVEQGQARAQVQRVDRFGNLQLNLTLADLARMGVALGNKIKVQVQPSFGPAGGPGPPSEAQSGRVFRAVIGETFSSVPEGSLVLTEDSNRCMALAVNKANAAHSLRAGLGSSVTLRRVEGAAADESF